jgi:hypothetical protein
MAVCSFIGVYVRISNRHGRKMVSRKYKEGKIKEEN